MEKPNLFIKTLSTSSTSPVPLVSVKISEACKGISYFAISIDPDPRALYNILIGRFVDEKDLELTAIWSIELPHLTCGVYTGFQPGDAIVITHRTADPSITVKSGISLVFNEVY